MKGSRRPELGLNTIQTLSFVNSAVGFGFLYSFFDILKLKILVLLRSSLQQSLTMVGVCALCYPWSKAEMDATVHTARRVKAMTFAALKGHNDCLNTLIVEGADVNAKLDGGATALMCAAQWGHSECALTLIKAGADVIVADKDGRSALRYAARIGCYKILVALIEAGADVNYKSNPKKKIIQDHQYWKL